MALRHVCAFSPSIRLAVERIQYYTADGNVAAFQYSSDLDKVLEDVDWPDRTHCSLNTAVQQFPLHENVSVDGQATPCWPVAEEEIMQDKVSADDVLRKFIVSDQLSERHIVP